ncbi:zinc finger, CCHC-type containing protein [Tanacetum coccineum]|uniref:Zinc finger, CCHC-type containing protein n=1 Tax=Tanacetum coccineum TaxID=301880 RepID=A0ABQ5C2E9_9ASTR
MLLESQLRYVTYAPKGPTSWSTILGQDHTRHGKSLPITLAMHRNACNLTSTSKLNDSILWHARLGHVHFKRMQDMSKDGLIPAFDMDTEKCKTCMLTQITKKPFQNVKHEIEVLEMIHSDLCDLHATPSLGNKKYFVTFIDDASRFCYVYLLHTKDEALDKFKVFKTEVELQKGSLIKRFKIDRGGEYMDTLYFQCVGIIHKTTAPYTPQQNGISERKNKVLKEMVNSMLSYSGPSQWFWGEAMAVVRLSDPKLKTLGERGIECIFVGYAEYSKNFRFYVIKPNDSVSINSIIESKDAIFDDNRFSSAPRPSQRSLINATEDIGSSVIPEKVTEENEPKTFDEEMKSQDVSLWKEAINDDMDSIMGNNTLVLADLPPGCKPLGCKWIFKRKLKVDGTIEKFKARLIIQGFKKNKRGIECIFVGYAEHSKAFRFYVIKLNDSVLVNSIIESRDAIFDENRFSSVPRPSLKIPNKTEDIGGSVVPEEEQGMRMQTSWLQMDIPKKAEVARMSTISLLIATASIHNLIIHQMDVKTTFFNGELEEEVYMNQPEGFIMPGNENKVCKLIKSLYGLKQAPKQWHQKFDEVVLSNGYLLNQADKCVYSKFDKTGKGVIIYLYVDGMLIFGTDQVQVDLTKEFLLSRFSIKDMGEADVILGIRIKHESNRIAISQSH